jgi:hypothetical protein
MPNKLIYLDTMLWNKFMDQRVDPARLMARLARQGYSLALSEHSIYELARTFKNNPQRGRELFQYLKAFLNSGVVCVYDNMRQLVGEVAVMNRQKKGVEAFYGPDDLALLKAEVDKLSRGILDSDADMFITERKAFSKSTRVGQRAHTESKPEVTERLKAVTPEQLAVWLDSEVSSDTGVAMLALHMMRPMEGKLPEWLAIRSARELIAIPQSRMAKTLVKADLYYNWRCANRGSIPTDLIDDAYHVVNAVYCHIYATEEDGQTEYASLLLTPATTVAVYPGDGVALEDWLVELTAPELA